ncbi:MAG: nitrous oxidase accessory protein [Methanolobus sp.]|nr:nitrous oxidase accessory protein [Methanolobus sp.]MDK2948077.1 nitrous oxidase accessory protein [Methanolobus sp.]
MIFLFLTVSCVSATTITVGDNSNTNNSFSSIQDAIDQAQKNDSIIIYSGTYSETLKVDKPLSIRSSSLEPDDVVITSNNSSASIIHITADNVRISGLTVKGDSTNPSVAGIFIEKSKNCHVSNNIISNTQDGFYIESSSGNEIQNNTVFSNIEHGIHLLDSTLSKLENNNILNNKRGLYVDESDQITIKDNKFSNNQMYGIALRKSSLCTITENQLVLNNIGLALTSSDENTVFGNNLNENNQYGLNVWHSNSNSVTDNYFSENKNSGIRLISLSSNNIFERNSFYSNLNGITIESTDNNIIKNNKFRSNEEYAIYHRFPDDKNTIEDNSFADNRAENIKLSPLQDILIVIITLIVLTIIAFHFGLSWLKKGLFGLVILIIISVILLLAWYFPFEAGMTENVEITNMQWTDNEAINETHTRGTLSFDLIYNDKYAYPNGFGDILSADIHISSRRLPSGNYELRYQEPLTLEYMEEYHYGQRLDLERENQEVLIQLYAEVFYDYPNPAYGDSKVEELGMDVLQINQSASDWSQAL